ncbi:hypothetical protein [Actinotalea sp. C106]|uniref:hypothetical protein n=1 Tax=Actinotalea sp. C106 TaxID=2908644 RepID=UPI002028388D|nr:hypothetical protein [Actinotalea sp. C106]
MWVVRDFGPAGWLFIPLGLVFAERAWRLATLRVHMTAESLVVGRYRRRRSIPWGAVRAVVARRRWWDGDRVEIVPETGEPVTALLKASWFDDSFERNLGVLRQRWRSQTTGQTRDDYSAAQKAGGVSKSS